LNEDESGLWRQIAPLLEAGMAGLNEKDRHAVVLRFFDGKSMSEVGVALGANEDAAKKRVGRALEKLRRFFARRGVNSTTAILAGAISVHSVQTAPGTLANSVIVVAMAKGAAASGSTFTLIKGALKLMAWTKAKTAVLTGVAILLAASTTTVAVKKHSSAVIENYFARLDPAFLKKVPPLLILRASRYMNDPQGDCIISDSPDMYKPGKLLRRDCTFGEILMSAYGFDENRIILPANAPKGRFDLLLTITNHPMEALSKKIKEQLGYTGRSERRDTNVLVLRITTPAASGLKTNTEHSDFWDKRANGQFVVSNFKMSDVAYYLGADYFNVPVVDETASTNSYDFDLRWNGKLQGNAQKKDVERALREQLGLELVPARRSLETLIVEKVP
jgi:uncharacterized protein (TIGR03435 family)